MRRIGVFLFLIALGALLYHWRGEEVGAFLESGLSEEGHPALLLLMYVLLPPFGFPINVFLVLLGIKFGGLPGALIMIAGMPIHLLAAFLLAHSFLRARVQKILAKMACPFPRVPPGTSLRFSLVFMAVPGLPYSIKNVVLALSGVPFRHFFLSGFLVQGAMGVPLVLAGEAVAGKNLLLAAGLLLVLLAISAAVFRLWKKRGVSALEKEGADRCDDRPGAETRRKAS